MPANQSVIYIAPPINSRGRWRVRWEPSREVGRVDEQDAVRFALDRARAIEDAGGFAVIKVERHEGTWETIRA